MNDRELIERAAKAAGLKIDKSPYNGGGSNNTGFDLAGNAVLDWHNSKTWNPLTDDGDALRLAVTLGISVDPRGTAVCAIAGDGKHVVIENGIGTSLILGTRRAIVRVAAEIGSTKS